MTFAKNGSYVEKYTAGHLGTKFEEFILIYEAMIAKNWPSFGCKIGQSDPIVMKLKIDMTCHLLNVYTKFHTDISKHVEKKSGKPDVRVDGQTDGQYHGVIRPFIYLAFCIVILVMCLYHDVFICLDPSGQ